LRPFLKENVIADVAELVDALDLGHPHKGVGDF